MTVIVTDTGFGSETLALKFVTLEEAQESANDVEALDVPSDTDPANLKRFLTAKAIRVDFPKETDGRGFTIARQLRLMGYSGLLRAQGHVIADQYSMARRSGFDEVEISEELAQRQPEDQWLFRSNWQSHDYQSRLRGVPPLQSVKG